MAVEAAQRALALFQCLGNLHCFSPTSSAPHLRHRFARLLAAQLRGRGAQDPLGYFGCKLCEVCAGAAPGARQPALMQQAKCEQNAAAAPAFALLLAVQLLAAAGMAMPGVSYARCASLNMHPR